MNEFFKFIVTGSATFAATNIDDIFILMLFFARGPEVYPTRSIIAGQYIGFTALVLIGMVGFFAGFLIPEAYIGLLGLVPIFLGIRAWFDRKSEAETEQDEKDAVTAGAKEAGRGLFAAIMAVSAITFANGGDNIGIYIPLFAGSTAFELLIILAVFYILLAVWCVSGYVLSKQQHIAHLLTHYSHYIVPFVFVGLGIFIMYECGTFEFLWKSLK